MFSKNCPQMRWYFFLHKTALLTKPKNKIKFDCSLSRKFIAPHNVDWHTILSGIFVKSVRRVLKSALLKRLLLEAAESIAPDRWQESPHTANSVLLSKSIEVSDYWEYLADYLPEYRRVSISVSIGLSISVYHHKVNHTGPKMFQRRLQWLRRSPSFRTCRRTPKYTQHE